MLKQIPRDEFGESFCALCEKPYIRHVGHLYKVTVKGKVYSLCSYTCYNKAKEWKEKVKHEDNM